MHFLTILTLATLLAVNLLCVTQAASLRPYHRRRGLEDVPPISELGWKIPLQSGKNQLRLW
jgi:hypothetical protein